MRSPMIAAALLLAAGCVTSQVQRTGPDVTPARAPDTVVVLDRIPDQPHQIIARIALRAETVFTSFDDLRARIVVRAAQLGGDAVVVGPQSSETEYIILPTGIIPSERKTLKAAVLVMR